MDKADNQIYQCYAEITLKNNDVVKLWSNTIKLDVSCTLLANVTFSIQSDLYTLWGSGELNSD